MKKLTASLLSLALLAASNSSTQAANVVLPVLLIVNDSDPSAVTFSATSAAPFTSDSTHFFYDGIDLMSLFSDPVAPLPTNLTPSVTTTGLTTLSDDKDAFDSSYVDHISGTEVDFNLYTRTTAAQTDAEDFSVDSQAFTGTAIVDLSDFASLLPASGIGELFAGYSGQYNPSIENPLVLLGDYEVVPEPSQWSLLLVGAAGLFALRRFRASRAR